MERAISLIRPLRIVWVTLLNDLIFLGRPRVNVRQSRTGFGWCLPSWKRVYLLEGRDDNSLSQPVRQHAWVRHSRMWPARHYGIFQIWAVLAISEVKTRELQNSLPRKKGFSCS